MKHNRSVTKQSNTKKSEPYIAEENTEEQDVTQFCCYIVVIFHLATSFVETRRN